MTLCANSVTHVTVNIDAEETTPAELVEPVVILVEVEVVCSTAAVVLLSVVMGSLYSVVMYSVVVASVVVASVVVASVVVASVVVASVGAKS